MMRDAFALVADYEPVDCHSKKAKKQILALAHHQEKLFDRRFFSPGHFTASGLVLSPDLQYFLLI